MATVSSCQGLQIQQERQRMQLYGKADHWRVVWSSCAVASSDILMVHLVIYSHSPSSPLSRHRHRPTRHNAAASRYLQARHAYNFSFDPLSCPLQRPAGTKSHECATNSRRGSRDGRDSGISNTCPPFFGICPYHGSLELCRIWTRTALPVKLSSNSLNYFSMSITEITLFYVVLALSSRFLRDKDGWCMLAFWRSKGTANGTPYSVWAVIP